MAASGSLRVSSILDDPEDNFDCPQGSPSSNDCDPSLADTVMFPSERNPFLKSGFVPSVQEDFHLASHGECDCGECKCHAGFIGDNCNCTTDISGCVSEDGQLCSGKGTCLCGQCQCIEPGAFGQTCEKCPTCPDACGTKRDCIECRLYQTGRLADNHTCHRLCKDEIVTVDLLETSNPEAVLCSYKTEKDCVMRFMYTEEEEKSILTVLREPECGSAPDALTVLLAVVGSILLVGLVLLAVWKLLVTIHDRREFAKFQNERTRARYEMASNPLYRQPISTHNLDEVFSMVGKSHNGTMDGFRPIKEME
ncbi:integrin beta-5-like [Bombina bombina]|uniref:integrin beta-5-like n=1 Tax=Bombina bombina TaxID=8345 RepID=UPI00235A6A06|nr:integrin beta-5-like [Bombina bombina]